MRLSGTLVVAHHITVTGTATRLIATFRPSLKAQISRISRSSKLAEDIRYSLARWPSLTRFLEDDRLGLDTNLVENQIKQIALTRKTRSPRGTRLGQKTGVALALNMRRGALGDISCP